MMLRAFHIEVSSAFSRERSAVLRERQSRSLDRLDRYGACQWLELVAVLA
jgi:hypothetical protein